MKAFFRTFFAVVLALIVLNIIIVATIVGIASKADKKPTVKENSLLHLTLDKPIVDRSMSSPLENFDFMTGENNAPIGLNDILNDLEKAATDDKIKGICLDISFLQAGMATVEEIRDALIDFKTKSEKPIIAYSEIYTQKAYYLATAADEIYLYPEGMMVWKGLSSTRMFMKGALEKLEVEAQVIRYGKYKSAVEPFLLDKMSEANKEQTMTYMSDLWNQMVEGVSLAREIPVEQLQLLSENLNIRNPEDALKHKLVDGLIYKDQLLEVLKEITGTEKEEDINYIDIAQYAKVITEKEVEDLGKEKIAIIYAQGGIESGDGDHETIGSESISKAIRKARQDETIKSIVLRVNSPGGSALASDVIWREVELAKEAKPVVVSMGDVAASGGYYIACGANKIVASETTITGSIGVFGVIPNFKNFFNNKLGLTFDGVKTNQFADMQTVVRPLSDAEKDIIQTAVIEIYQDFIGKVGQGREKTPEEIDEIGQGRVWSGLDAKEIGLVDEFGGLSRSIEIAAELADLKDYRVVEYPKRKSPMEQIISELTGNEEAKIAEQLGVPYQYYKQIQSWLKMDGMQARLPYLEEID